MLHSNFVNNISFAVRKYCGKFIEIIHLNKLPRMKKIIVLSTAFLLFTAVSFAQHNDKPKCCKHKSSKCCHRHHGAKGGMKKEEMKKDGDMKGGM